MIHLLIHKANTMLGIIEVFNSLHNYAFETFLLMLSHTQCAPDNICKTKQARDYLKAHFMDSNCFSPQKRKSPCLCFLFTSTSLLLWNMSRNNCNVCACY